jgi:hypothetical protein
MVTPEWQIKRWQETNDQPRLEACQRHLRAGASLREAVAAAGADKPYRPTRPDAPREPVLAITLLALVALAMLVLIGVAVYLAR